MSSSRPPEKPTLASRLRRALRAGSVDDTLVAQTVEPTLPETHGARSFPNACGLSDVGHARAHNEDAFHVADDGHLLIVADGMGGHRAGEVASALAVQKVVDVLEERWHRTAPADGVLAALLLDAFAATHQHVLQTAQSRREYRGMGTTLIVACIRGDRLHVCHVGDVRGYVRTRDGVRQLTQDHSVVGALVRAGQLTPDAARQHARRHEILQAVGVGSDIEPDVTSCDLAAGDEVLLCSDGLWEMLSEGELAGILAGQGSLEARAEQLIEGANAAGGHDNITVVLYRHGNVPASSEIR
jgi:protein phosphatase